MSHHPESPDQQQKQTQEHPASHSSMSHTQHPPGFKSKTKLESKYEHVASPPSVAIHKRMSTMFESGTAATTYAPQSP